MIIDKTNKLYIIIEPFLRQLFPIFFKFTHKLLIIIRSNYNRYLNTHLFLT